MAEYGIVTRINGSLVFGKNIPDAKIGDVVYLGEQKLIGEIVRIKEDTAAIQCYEDTSGLRPRDVIENTNEPLSAELGPGLLGEIFDGLQFSEIKLWEKYGPFMQRGAKISRIDRTKKWDFTPTKKKGDEVNPGDIIGEVPESLAIIHKIMIPPTTQPGKIIDITEGKYHPHEPIATIETIDGEKIEITMIQTWPVRKPRPVKQRLPITEPLVTGQRVIDTFFQIPKGGTAAIPGGFGTGKTVTLHQLAKWSDSNVVVYIGCGERGNEMADVITHFPSLLDPYTGKPLSERSVFIANVSNLPVFAREASIYMGVTIAEYYRDMGYHVALMADSTSRWAEALRDISGRLEEIPVERGFPAYLAERIAAFYERAGRVIALGSPERVGSLTIMGAVSPPGGDFSEPVTSITMRFVGTLWALDKNLAFQRHFPAINWLISFTKYAPILSAWWNDLDPEFSELRIEALSLLEEASKIEETARIVGEKSLPEDQRHILLIAEILREGYLYQNAFHEVDTFCPPEKQVKMLRAMLEFYYLTRDLVRQGVPTDVIRELSTVTRLKRMRIEKETEFIDETMEIMRKEVEELKQKYAGMIK